MSALTLADLIRRVEAMDRRIDALYALVGPREAPLKSPCQTTPSSDPDGAWRPPVPAAAVLEQLQTIRAEQVRAATLLEQIHDRLMRPSVPFHARREASPEESPASPPCADGGV